MAILQDSGCHNLIKAICLNNMYYRRKIALALLEQLSGRADKIRFMKLLFLLCRNQETPVYGFVPYRYGCFSFTANADMSVMVKRGMIREEEKAWLGCNKVTYTGQLTEDDRAALYKTMVEFGSLDNDALIGYTYKKYPYFAINSKIADKYPVKKEVAGAKAALKGEETVLFSIGYEGKSLEAYLNLLIEHRVRTLVDVRKNPLSMKYGFSKNQLKNACTGVGIGYRHVPQLGIVSDKRKSLQTKDDYERLFAEYEQIMLPITGQYQDAVAEELKQEKRIALTCFEADPEYCHRSYVAPHIAKRAGAQIPVQHL